MKKIILLVFSALLCILYSCKDEEKIDEACNGAPVINTIKKTVLDEEGLTGPAAFGDWLIIEGANFCDVQEILINDVEVNLYDVYAESGMISFAIPRQIPVEDTQTITITTSRGTVVSPFSVIVPQFILEGLLCEYVFPGDTAYLKGENFDLYNIDTTSTIIQIGDSLMPVNYIDAEQAFFRIPKTATPSQVMTLINKDSLGNVLLNQKVPGLLNDYSKVVFGFRDIVDPPEQIAIREFRFTDGVGEVGFPKPINEETGKYGVIKGNFLEWNWDQFLCERNGLWIWWGDASIINENEIVGPAENMMVKLEMIVPNDWVSGSFIIKLFGYEYLYEPWREQGSAYKTTEWRTVRIPLTSFKLPGTGVAISEISRTVNDETLGIVPLEQWKYTQVFYNGVAHTNLFICWDNLRCVAAN